VLPIGGAVNVLSAARATLNHQGTLSLLNRAEISLTITPIKRARFFSTNVTAKTFTQVTNQTFPASPTQDDFNKWTLTFSRA